MSLRTLLATLVVSLSLLMSGCETESTDTTMAEATADDPAPATATARAPAPRPAASPTRACQLTMGWDPWEPYHYRDVGGEVRGLDIELVAAIARAADCSVRYDQEDWATLLSRVRNGEVDMLSGATRTSERERFAWFTVPYRTESFRLYMRRGEVEASAADTVADLLAAGKRIGVVSEYVYSDEVEALAADPRYADQFEAVAVGAVNFEKLLNQDIDALIEDGYVAASIVRKKGLENQVEEHPLVVSSGDVHLMLSRDSVDEQTVTRINAALAELKESGNYQRIIERYLN